jgi:hypothetical protein
MVFGVGYDSGVSSTIAKGFKAYIATCSSYLASDYPRKSKPPFSLPLLHRISHDPPASPQERC